MPSVLQKYISNKQFDSNQHANLIQDKATGELFLDTTVSVKEKVLDDFVQSWSGYNIQGLESGSPSSPGTIGINYIAKHDTKYVDWLVEQGLKTYRIPFMLERLCPVPNQAGYQPGYAAGFNNLQYAKIITDFAKECQLKGVQTFLDAHNYGAYTFQANATMSSVGPITPANFYNFFDDRYKVVSNQLQIRNPTDVSLPSCYEIVVAGQKNNSTPAKIETTVRITSTAGDVENSLQICGCYIDNDNYLAVNINPTQNNVDIIQKLNGGEPFAIATVSVPTVTLNTDITVVFELGKASDPTNNIWRATVNGVVVYNQPVTTSIIDSKFTMGQWGYKTEGSNANIISYLYTIYGTTAAQGYASASQVFWGKTIGSRSYDVGLHTWFYEQLYNIFDDMPSLVGYMYNEPHDLLVPTTPANYKTTATATVFQQAALNKLRQLGSNKWFGWTSDNYGGIQNIIAGATGPVVWGTGFDVPFTDDKTFLDLHYYSDFYPTSIYSGSGTYGSIPGSGTFQPYTQAQIIASIEPVLLRIEAINATRKAAGKPRIPFVLSETGIPEDPTWWSSLATICLLVRKYKGAFQYFGIGEFFPNRLDNISADPNEYLFFGSTKTLNLTISQQRHRIIREIANS